MVNDGVEIYIIFAVTARVSFRKAGGTHPLDLFLSPLIEVVETLILRSNPFLTLVSLCKLSVHYGSV